MKSALPASWPAQGARSAAEEVRLEKVARFVAALSSAARFVAALSSADRALLEGLGVRAVVGG